MLTESAPDAQPESPYNPVGGGKFPAATMSPTAMHRPNFLNQERKENHYETTRTPRHDI